MKYKLIILLCLIYIIFSNFSCTNPFAPKLNPNSSENAILGDQKTIEGVFENFRYSYIFKDTLIYGKLLAPDFAFTYFNYDLGVQLSWGRDQDMISTYGLFQAAQSLDLIWNEVVISIGDSLVRDISRGFNLTIFFSQLDVIRLTGRANFRLVRKTASENWMISIWRDESNY